MPDLRAPDVLERALALAAALGRAATLGAIAEVAVAEAAAAGAVACVVAVISADGGRLEVIGGAAPASGATIALDARDPIAAAVRTRAPVWGEPRGARGTVGAALPLLAGDRALGALALELDPCRHLDDRDRLFLLLVASEAALAVARLLAEDGERRARAELGALRDAGITPYGVQALRASEERLRIALSTGRMMGWEWLPEEGKLAWSGPAREILGLPPGAEIGTLAQVSALVHPDDRVRANQRVRDAVQRGEAYALKYRMIRPIDGAVIWVESRGRGILDARGHVEQARGVLMDITAREEAEQQRAAAELTSQLKDEFLARVSHELRTPLAAQRMWLEVLRNGRPEDRGLAIEAVDKSARTQSKLIGDLLDLARGINGKLRITAVILDPIVPIEEAVNVMRPEAEAKSILLYTAIASDAGFVRGDAGRLEQVVVNLLSNAIKFTPAGGRVEVVLRADGGSIVLSVSDTGAGIEPTAIDAVFAPFEQLDRGRSQGGLGLGLAIARQLVELHGGSIRAESRGAGRGATFEVRLPRVADDELPVAASQASRTLTQRFPLSGLCVMLVEDHTATREGLARLLAGFGAEVIACADAETAFSEIGQRRVNVILSDLALPGQDGCAFIRAVRALGGEIAAIPALALTALARPEDAVRAIRAGFQVHLAKPVESEDLIDSIARVVGRGTGASMRRTRRSWPG